MTIELKTGDNLQYVYYPMPGHTLRFKLKAANDGHIIFSHCPNPTRSDPTLEIFIGGWDNQKSVLRKNRMKPDKTEVRTPYILSSREFRGFWITCLGGAIAVGCENQWESFLSWLDPAPNFTPAFFGVCTGWGSSGEWILHIDDQTNPMYDSPLYRFPAMYGHLLGVNENGLSPQCIAPCDTRPLNYVDGCSCRNMDLAHSCRQGKPDEVTKNSWPKECGETTNRFLSVGKNVEEALSVVHVGNSDNSVIAEKLINDVMHLARLGKLNKNTCIAKRFSELC